MGEDNRDDFTLLESLGEFEHSEDEEINQQLGIVDEAKDGHHEGGFEEETSFPPPPPEEEASEFQETEFQAEESPSLPDFNFEPEPEPEIEPEPEPETVFDPEPETVFDPDPEPEFTASHTPQETFDDIKDFGQNASPPSEMSVTGGNPPFSIILKNIIYKEDMEDILIILREQGIINENSREACIQSMKKGFLLIPQISEFTAVFLCHKFRRFDLDIAMGLSDEIHPSKTFVNPRGLVNKNNLKQDRAESINLSEAPIDVNLILLSTTPHLEGHQIAKYLGIVSSHRTIDEEDLFREERLNKDPEKSPKKPKLHKLSKKNKAKDEEIDLEKYAPTLNKIYQTLADELRPQALMLKGNAVIGINYQITPLIPTQENSYKTKYQLNCTGNVVWVV